MKKGIVVALVVGLAAALLAPAELAARAERVPTKLTLKNLDPTFYEGTVSSKDEACEKRRLVKVVHDEDEDGADSGDYLIGTDLTDKEGKYEVEGNQAPMGDRIVALTKRRTLSDGTICLGKEKAAAALG
jgi:hypothetical protein